MKVKLTTNKGEIVLALDAVNAPETTKNFLSYVQEGFYDGTIFHRVIEGFMIQGGGHLPDLKPKAKIRAPIKNEADNGLSNTKGTIAMARTGDPHSASSQFFINAGDNKFLDHKAPTPEGWGYCVFGEVDDGMDVVTSINQTRTDTRRGMQDVPVEDILLERAEIVEDDAA